MSNRDDHELNSSLLARCEYCHKWRWRIYWFSKEGWRFDSWCTKCRPDYLTPSEDTE